MIALSISAIAIVISAVLPDVPTPLGLGQVPYMFVFFWAGAVMNGKEFPFWAAIPAAIIYAGGFIWGPEVDVKYMKFGWPVAGALIAMSGVTITIVIGKIISGVPYIKDIVATCGRYSLTIMYVHMVILSHTAALVGDIASFGLALSVSLALHYLLEKFSWGRVLFLGQGVAPAILTSTLGKAFKRLDAPS